MDWFFPGVMQNCHANPLPLSKNSQLLWINIQSLRTDIYFRWVHFAKLGKFSRKNSEKFQKENLFNCSMLNTIWIDFFLLLCKTASRIHFCSANIHSDFGLAYRALCASYIFTENTIPNTSQSTDFSKKKILKNWRKRICLTVPWLTEFRLIFIQVLCSQIK